MPVRRLIVLLMLALSLFFAASAHAYVYWANFQGGTIGRANLDGTNVEGDFIATGGHPIGVAVTSTNIYWANESAGTIGRANLDGTAVDPNFITGINRPWGVAVTPSFIYWPSLSGNEIGRANLDGTGKTLGLVTGVTSPCSIATDGGHVYWGSGATPAFVGQASLTGSSPKPEWVNLGTYAPCGLAVNSANVFVANFAFISFAHEIGRVGINGGVFQPSLIGEADGPCGLTINGSKLYWANSGSGTIGVANTDGTSVDEEFVQTGTPEICGVAVDSGFTPPIPPVTTPTGGGASGGDPSSPPPTPPPGTIRLGKLKRNPKRGTARQKVVVDEAGVVSLTGKGIAPVKVTAAGAGTVTLAVRAAKSKLAKLKQVGKLTAKLTVVFTPSNRGTAARASRSLTLHQNRPTD
jgi:hypothetical protein